MRNYNASSEMLLEENIMNEINKPLSHHEFKTLPMTIGPVYFCHGFHYSISA